MNRYQLIGKDGRQYESAAPGTLGGHRATRIYGRLDCPSALRALANGGYAMNRVFFADEATAVAAGYRPCARCLPEPYRDWRERANTAAPAIPSARNLSCNRAQNTSSLLRSCGLRARVSDRNSFETPLRRASGDLLRDPSPSEWPAMEKRCGATANTCSVIR